MEMCVRHFMSSFFQLCKKQFQYSASLRAHLIRHTRKDAPSSSSSNSASNESSGSSSEKGRTKREFICSICGRTLPKLYSLRIHMLKHTGVKPHACQVRCWSVWYLEWEPVVGSTHSPYSYKYFFLNSHTI